MCFFFFQAEDGIRDLVRSRGLGDVYKRQRQSQPWQVVVRDPRSRHRATFGWRAVQEARRYRDCLLYTSDAADERSSVDLGGRRIIKKKKDTANIGNDLKIKRQITRDDV